MLCDGALADEQYSLLRWPAPVVLADGTALWLGTTQTLHVNKPLGAAVLWRPLAHDGAAHAAVQAALGRLNTTEMPHPDSGVPVLRVRTDHPTHPHVPTNATGRTFRAPRRAA